jgi:hypothetical protein
MEARQQRGLVIAAMVKLTRNEQGWIVPSSSGGKCYVVDPIKQTCTCPDHQEKGYKCKHLFAVEITIKREVGKDGTITETSSITFTEEKVQTGQRRILRSTEQREESLSGPPARTLQGHRRTDPPAKDRTAPAHLSGLDFFDGAQGLCRVLGPSFLLRSCGRACQGVHEQTYPRHENHGLHGEQGL